jgi:CDP-paratose 2-epimerase
LLNLLITGGCGFVGYRLAVHLKAKGYQVMVMDNLVRRGSEINIARLKDHNIGFIHGDVRNWEDFASLPESFDLICDASAQPSVVTGYGNPRFDIANNALGAINILEYARRHDCAVIFWSTNRVYSADKINSFPLREGATRWQWDRDAFRARFPGHPVAGFDPDFGFSEEFSIDGGQRSIYGLSKLMADVACQEYATAFGVKTVVNRFGVIAGEGQFGKSDQGWVSWWALAFHFALPLKYIGWGGKQVRDVLFVDDVCRLVDLEMERLDSITGQVFNVGGGMAQSLSLVEATALLREKFGRDLPVALEPQARQADQIVYVTDNRKVEQALGWSPQIGIGEGYDRIIQWIKENESPLRKIYG